MSQNSQNFSLSGATRVIAIIGDPIAQVKSPAGVTRMLQAQGHDAIVVPVHVKPEQLGEYMRAAAIVRNLDGIIVTIPHKFSMRGYCSTVTERADFLGAVNTLRRNDDDSWDGDMFDGEGMIGGIRAHGGNPAGQRCLLVGAGGAGTAIALELLVQGACYLAIHDADTRRRDDLIARLQARYGDKVGVGSDDPSGFGVVVNATPMGMNAGDPMPIQVNRLDSSAFAACPITSPAVSPWIQAARERGCKTSVGADMFNSELKLMVDFLAARLR
ncbi:shikimate dehydrogenase family protein [Kerstersia similis]|uniref:shikimate dehydrogenase family protein n=1 Tax=Kerstersia similis TaxID=206505 RepID=UPI0039F08B73